MNSGIKYIFIVIALILGSSCTRDAPLNLDTPDNKISAELNSTIPALMDKYAVPGLAIGIIRNGRLTIVKSFGYSDIGLQKKMQENTVFQAASLGKPVFAYIAVTLARRGVLDLDVPLYTYINEEVVTGDARSKRISARMVLSHSSGLPNLDIQQADMQFAFEPGAGFKYSGHAYLYLQRVLEKISGKSLQQLADEIVFAPLHMAHSGFIWKSAYSELFCSSYDNDGGKISASIKPDKGYSAWSLFTTLRDYAKFVAHIMATSSDPQSIAAAMLQSNVVITDKVSWGLGWGLQATQPNSSFWHWGSMAGFRHFVVGYTKERIAVVVLSNGSRAFKIIEEAMAKAIGGRYPAYEWF